MWVGPSFARSTAKPSVRPQIFRHHLRQLDVVIHHEHPAHHPVSCPRNLWSCLEIWRQVPSRRRESSTQVDPFRHDSALQSRASGRFATRGATVLRATYRVDAETDEQQRRNKSLIPLEERLQLAAESLAELVADPDQIVRVEVVCRGVCPAALQGAVLRILRELVGMTVKHGLYQRLMGCIREALISGPEGTRLVVGDDGWSLCSRPSDDQGLRRVGATVASLGGTLALQSGDGVIANVFLPSPRPHRGFDPTLRVLRSPHDLPKIGTLRRL